MITFGEEKTFNNQRIYFRVFRENIEIFKYGFSFPNSQVSDKKKKLTLRTRMSSGFF